MNSKEDECELNGVELQFVHLLKEERSHASTVKPQYHRLLSTVMPASLPPERAPLIALIAYVFGALGVAAVVLVGTENLLTFDWWAIMFIVLFGFISVIALLVMLVHVQNTNFDTFKVS